MSAVRIKHLVLDMSPACLSYHSGINQGDLYLKPSSAPGTYSVNLGAGQYQDLKGGVAGGEATVQLDDGRIFAGDIVSSTKDLTAEKLSGPLELCLNVMELKFDLPRF
ncbi:hypothetical protein [Pseudomonas sp. LS-2]|jgi:hypothetical protein|uniref:hypothetical protein n=1 Tax=Pseudomonas sp. LS-2 TaxID=2315859 RepID=UPI000E722F24|nr:hypothetical protein [Pseudomonas sp. LS-2]RJX82796.1 hypothetical protein D3M70_03745 [Pseudomonas sp. LS-2]